MEKYGFTGLEKNGLKQIVALKDFGSIKKGDIGGWIQYEHNLSQKNNCWIRENALIYGNALIRENAIIYGNAKIHFGHCVKNIKDDLCESIRCQTGLGVFNGKVIAYKQVKKNLTSFHDSTFQYVVGEFAEVENAEVSNVSCASGLHFSNMNYWNGSENVLNSTFIMAEIDISDIITVQEGKIRCKRAKILAKYDIKGD